MNTSAAEENRYQELQQLALQYAREGEDKHLLPMLKHGMPVNLADHKGNTLLMLASYHGHVSTLTMLLTEGADPNRINDRGQTPMSGAIFKGYPEVVEALYRGGARLDRLVGARPGEGENSASMKTNDNSIGRDALKLAALFGQKDVLRLLRRLIAEETKKVSNKPYDSSASRNNKLGWLRAILPELVVSVTGPLRYLGAMLFTAFKKFKKVKQVTPARTNPH